MSKVVIPTKRTRAFVGAGRSTLADVAGIAGVALSTASLAIAGKSAVTEKTRRKVLAVSRELGYVPNSSASSLASAKTMSLAVVLPDPMNPYSMEIAHHMGRYAGRTGYRLGMYFTGKEAAREAKLLRMGLERRVDGLIIVPDFVHENRELYLQLLRAHIPLVIYGAADIPDFLEGKVDVVTVNMEKAGRLGASHLVGLGRKRIACIYTGEMLLTTSSKVNGYVHALRNLGLVADLSLMVSGGRSLPESYEAMKKILSHEGTTPDGVFCCSDFMAIGAMRAILDAGLKIPEDIAVVGLDDTEHSRYFQVPLTSIDCRIGRACELAVEMLMKQIGGEPSSGITEILEPVLVERESTCGKQETGNGQQ